MSEKAVFGQEGFHGTANGTAIRIHLDKIYEDFISETFGAKVQ